MPLKWNPIGAGDAGGAERLWYHDWRLDADADYSATPPTSIGGLTVTAANTGAFGPDGGLGMRAVTGGYGRLDILWSSVAALMARPLHHGDTLVLEVQHALASNSIVADLSQALGQVIATPPTERNTFAGLWRYGTFRRHARFWTGGWPPSHIALNDNAAFRSTSHWVRTGSAEAFFSTDELSAAVPLSGTDGPFTFSADTPLYARNLTSASNYDFVTGAGRFRLQIESNETGGVPAIMEAAAIWLVPGTPNEP